MINPFLSAVLIAILVGLGLLLATTNFETQRVVICELVEFHPDMTKYREQCRQIRRGRP